MKSLPTNVGFDRVAGVYEFAERCTLGSVLQRARVRFIPALRAKKNALVFGDGDGRFLAAFLRSNKELAATAVDISERMLTLLQRRCVTASARLMTVRASAFDVHPSADTDLIVTHFFLDCLSQPEVELLVQTCTRGCNSNLHWLISDFQIPNTFWGGALGKAYIRLLYVAFRILTGLRTQHLPDPRVTLRRAGFRRIAYHSALCGLVYTELWQFAHVERAQPHTV